MYEVIVSFNVRVYLRNWLILLFLTLVTLANISYAAVNITEPAKKEVFVRAGEKAVLYWNYTVDDRMNELQYVAFRWMVAVPPYSTSSKKTIWQELDDGKREVGPDIPSFLRNRAKVIGRATLEIMDINKNDSNTYFFEARTASAGTLSSAVNLTVTVLPVAKVSEDCVVAGMDETKTLTCEATGVPVPEIIWTMWGNNQTLPSSEKVVGGTIYSNLNITGKLHKAGEYVCTAELPTGETSNASVYFNVENIRATTHEVVIENCNSQSLCCPVSGFPQPLYRWTFPNETLITESKLCLPKGAAGFGKYVCHARNSKGSVSVSMTCGPEPTKIEAIPIDINNVKLRWNTTGEVISLIEAREGTSGKLCYTSCGEVSETILNYYSLDRCERIDPLGLVLEVIIHIKTGDRFTPLYRKTITIGARSSAVGNYRAGFIHVAVSVMVVLSILRFK